MPLALYSAIGIFLAASYILGTILHQNWLNWIGGFWIAVFLYLLLFCICLNLYSLWAWKTGWNPSPAWIFPAILILTALIVAYGAWNAANPKLVSYELTVPQSTPELNIVAVSDIHLGAIHDLSTYAILVEKINNLNPDLVLFLGDVIDGYLNHVDPLEFALISQRLNATHGVYGVLGNHERYAGPNETVLPYFTNSNIEILVDSFVSPCPGLYLAGVLSNQHDPHEIMIPITEILKDKPNDNWPLILMNHVPDRLSEAQTAGVFLMLSGHTHHGQLFPGNVVTSLMFENSHGHIFQAGMHSIVSSGYGTWGPPVRTGSYSELLQIQLVHEK